MWGHVLSGVNLIMYVGQPFRMFSTSSTMTFSITFMVVFIVSDMVALKYVVCGVSQSVDFGRSNNPNTTPTKDYEIVQVVVYLHSVQRGYAEEGKRGSTPTG